MTNPSLQRTSTATMDDSPQGQSQAVSPSPSPTHEAHTQEDAATFSNANHHQYIQGRYLHSLPPFDAIHVPRVLTSSRLHTASLPTSPTDKTPLLPPGSSQGKDLDEAERAVMISEGVGGRGYAPGNIVVGGRPRPPTPLPKLHTHGSQEEGGGGKLKVLTRRLSSAGSHAATVAASAIKRTGSIKGGHVRRGSSSSARSGGGKGSGSGSGGEGETVASKWGWTWLKKEKRWERRRQVEGGGLSVEEDGEEGEEEKSAGPAFR